jgi:hypothetical protein
MTGDDGENAKESVKAHAALKVVEGLESWRVE